MLACLFSSISDQRMFIRAIKVWEEHIVAAQGWQKLLALALHLMLLSLTLLLSRRRANRMYESTFTTTKTKLTACCVKKTFVYNGGNLMSHLSRKHPSIIKHKEEGCPANTLTRQLHVSIGDFAKIRPPGSKAVFHQFST